MEQNRLQSGDTEGASVLLHIAVALVLLQFVCWVMGHQSWDASTDSTSDKMNRAHIAAVATRVGILPHRDTSARGSVNQKNRFYDPGLAMAAENLDPASRYNAAMVLEECYAISRDGHSRFRDDFMLLLSAATSNTDRHSHRAREYAFDRSNRDCIIFDGIHISPGYILGLIKSAAHDGDPRAVAHTLLFRDLAEDKVGNVELVTRLLATGDPRVIRDVGFYLTRGESMVTLIDRLNPVRATTLAVAWELVACDYGLDCGADSKLLSNLCAYQSQCFASSYEDWLSRHSESREEYAEILELRKVLRRGLMLQDWPLLGLTIQKP